MPCPRRGRKRAMALQVARRRRGISKDLHRHDATGGRSSSFLWQAPRQRAVPMEGKMRHAKWLIAASLIAATTAAWTEQYGYPETSYNSGYYNTAYNSGYYP